MKLKHVFFVLASLVLLIGCDKTPEITGIAIEPAKLTIEGVGNTATVTAIVAPEGAKTSNIKWSTSNSAIITVERNGATVVITAVGKGTAKVVATADIFTAECEVLVKDEGTGGDGDLDEGLGTEEAPYNVTQVLGIFDSSASLPKGVWATGYIVGGVIDDNNQTSKIESNDAVVYGAEGVRATAVLIADSKDVTDYTSCVIVQLSGDARNIVNLKDNPGNLHKRVAVEGNLARYFTIPGVRDVSDFTLEGYEPPVDVQFTTKYLDETLLTQASFGKFTTVSVKGAQVWEFDSQYGAKMSGFAESKSHENEDWLISPAIDLAGKAGTKVKFDHARGPAAEMSTGIAEGWYKVYATADYKDVATTTWVELEGVVHGTAAWGYVNSGAVEIPASAISANTRIAFKYLCSDAKSATWEIKNVQVGQ